VGEALGSAHSVEAMNSITIIEQRCPNCANRRTVRFGCSSNFFCFNCRQPLSGRALQHGSDYPFTDADLSRLRIYRSAVRAGFYNDW
jgi:hypothetical protein